MDDDVAGLHQRQKGRRNRRHAGGEYQGVLRPLPQRQPVLEDFLIGSVEA